MPAPALVAPDPPLADPSGRFVLRPWVLDDAPALVAAWRDPAIAEWCTVPADASERGAARWIAGWAERAERGLALDLVAVACHVRADGSATLPAAGTVLAEVGLRRLARPASQPGPEVYELGWWTGAAHRGTGVAAASAGLLARWATTAVPGQLIARVPVGHRASECIAEAAGLSRRGELPSGQVLWARF